MERSFGIKPVDRSSARIGWARAWHVRRRGGRWSLVAEGSRSVARFPTSASSPWPAIAAARWRMSRVSTRSGSIGPYVFDLRVSSRMRSMTFRSRIWVASESAPPSFSTRERTRRTLSSVRAAIDSISSASVLLARLRSSRHRRSWPSSKNSLSERRVVSWALARIWASLARISLSDIPPASTARPACWIVLFSSRRHQVGRELERRLPEQLVDDLPANRLALLGLDPALQSLAHGLAQFVHAVEADRIEELLRSTREAAAASDR